MFVVGTVLLEFRTLLKPFIEHHLFYNLVHVFMILVHIYTTF